ncbi:MAG: serine/threonine protein kinase [Clostridiales bacterium]|nr:serine/threonine protein kinase [Clostridiales bacterium]
MGKILKNRYELLTELGHGGMSTVYLARDMNLGSYWAVKQMKNNASNELFAFKQEVELLAGLSHPDIPRIVDRIEDMDDYYVVMDFVDGVSLSKRLMTEGPVDEETLINWSKMLCSILQYLHTVRENPIVYRDMKPDNIILSQSGRVKLIDFGIAKECVRGTIDKGECYGTRGYAAPEQYKSGSNILDERTDIYSLGCTMFYLITGQVPGKAPNACPPVRTINPNLSEGIQFIIAKATQDEPADRYQSCDEMINDLDHITELSYEYKETMRKRLLSFCLCVLFTIVFAGVSVVGYIRIQDDHANKFQIAYNKGFSLERLGSYDDAAEYYTQAITYNDSDYNTYVKLFNALLPHSNTDDYSEKTKLAIDQMTGAYIDNSSSAMYKDPRLMFLVGKKCIEVNEISYTLKASEYFSLIKDSSLYKSGQYSFVNLDQYSLIAESMANTIDSQDFGSLEDALEELEESNKTSRISVEDKLQNYYTMILIYCTYPTNLNNSYEKIQELGMEAYDLITVNMDNEEFEFNSIYPLYEMLAIGNYNAGLTSTDETMIQYYKQSIEWFERLESLYFITNNDLYIKKANAYEKMFSYMNRGLNAGEASEESIQLLRSAISIYGTINRKDPDFLMCRIKLGFAYAELANATNDEAEIAKALEYYDELRTDIETNYLSDLSTTEAFQWSSLTDLMTNYGFIEE